MSNKYPWSKFFWSDWEADQNLKLCSLAAQGLWMRLLCVCAKSEPRGYVTVNGNPLAPADISRLVGVPMDEVEALMSELDQKGVFSRNRAGVIYSRRMIKDEKRSKDGRKHKISGLTQAAEKKQENPAPSRVPTSKPARGASTQKPESRVQNNNNSDKSSLLLSARTARDDDDNFQKKDEGGLQGGLQGGLPPDASPDASPEPPPDHYQRFLAAHPRPRETDRGEDAWDEAIASGVDPETILNAARRYAQVSATYDRDKVKFSDNWLIEQAWERYPAPTGMAQQAELSAAERQRLSDEKQAEFIKSGKRFFCTGISAARGRDLIAKGLVTQAECESVGVL